MIICRQVSHDTHERVTLVILESFLLNKSDTDDDDDLHAGFHVYKSEKTKTKKRREKLVWNLLLLLLQCIVVLLLLLRKVTTDFLPFP
jgi:hypothetical protein